MMVTTTNLIKENSSPKNCQYCGKPFKPCEITVLGRTSTVYACDCNCYEKEQARKAAEKRKEWLKEKFQNANIGKRYADITLDILEEWGTENVAAAKEFVEKFNPEEGKSLHFIGEFGNGKTSLGYAILKALLLKNFNCVSITWNDFVTRCYYAKSYASTETVEQLLAWICQFDLVMLDEFVVNVKDEKEINLASTLFDNLYKDNKSFILINNPCDITDIKTVARLGKVLDRIKHQAEILKFTHPSYRRSENA